MPAIWRFRYYVEPAQPVAGKPRTKSDVREIYEQGSAQKKARFLSKVKTLAHLPRDEWNENYIKKLVGECDGLEEIRFKADNIQQRPLGWRSGPLEFTILFWAIEKGGKFVPKSACKTALGRKKQVIADDRKYANALWLVLE